MFILNWTHVFGHFPLSFLGLYRYCVEERLLGHNVDRLDGSGAALLMSFAGSVSHVAPSWSGEET